MKAVTGGKALGVAALVLVGGVLLAGCGSGSDDSSAPVDDGSSSMLAQTDLEISVWPEGKDAGEPQRYTLTCPEPSGTHPDPARACEAISELTAGDFEPVPPGAMCTEIYGGPQQARLEGTFAGGEDVIPVALDLSRENGCQIDLFDRFAAIVPAG